MVIFPAIDLRQGKAVRLIQGDYEQMTVYSEDPVHVAREFAQAGADHLHLVDLDGAKDGKLVNFETIKEITTEVGMFVQVGGGIRDEPRICQYLEIGVARVILGTIALTNLSFLEAMVKRYEEKIAVGVDAKDGFVAIHGWKEVTNIPAVPFCKRLEEIGVRTVIYTDIEKDGGLAGTNLEVYDTLSRIKGLEIIASGGISFSKEIVALSKKVNGAILGKALYTGALDLGHCIALASGEVVL